MAINRQGAPFFPSLQPGLGEPRPCFLVFIVFKNFRWGPARDANAHILSVRNQGCDEALERPARR
eukprot:4408411-Alexandrium_andersonii.AAC.1